MEQWIERLMPKISDGLARCRSCPVGRNTEEGLNLAGMHAVRQVLEDLISILFPGCHGKAPVPEAELDDHLSEKLKATAVLLKEQVRRALLFRSREGGEPAAEDVDVRAEEAVARLIQSLPEIQNLLQQDILAAFEGDPAAQSSMEVVMSYPGLFAVIVHRIAHLLYRQGVPLIPRIMSEHAHSQTGIDIHPGAEIGPAFFIDHGTGVVIGETCTIGRNVKIYQGVTLGALSFEKDEQGRPVKGIKRHPDVGDNVVIYAGATILGGATRIGDNSEIGGNVWLTHSVPPGSRVYNQQPSPLIRPGNSGGGDR